MGARQFAPHQRQIACNLLHQMMGQQLR